MNNQPDLSQFPRLTNVNGLRNSGIFPEGKVPSERTVREWTRQRRIPHIRIGHFIYYDPVRVAHHINSKLEIPTR